jgi:hypothetical protein
VVVVTGDKLKFSAFNPQTSHTNSNSVTPRAEISRGLI